MGKTIEKWETLEIYEYLIERVKKYIDNSELDVITYAKLRGLLVSKLEEIDKTLLDIKLGNIKPCFKREEFDFTKLSYSEIRILKLKRKELSKELNLLDSYLQKRVDTLKGGK